MSLAVDIRKRLATFELEVSFETSDAGEILALLGPSGCGKTVTLRCIAGVMAPDEGRIALNGRVLFDSRAGVNLPPRRRRVGYLFQQYALFPTMTVAQNIAAGTVGVPRRDRMARVAELVHRFGLDGLERLRPAELSGGEQQRAALARMLAGRPELIMLDEPFSALDEHLRWRLETELADTLHGFAGGALFVSHDFDEARRLCDSVCVMAQGSSEPKRPVAELFEAPRTRTAALISGCKNIVPAWRTASGRLACEDWGVELTTEQPVPECVTHAGVHAYRLRALDAPRAEGGVNCIPCRVARVFEGARSVTAVLETPGEGSLHYECDMGTWEALGSPRELTVEAPPSAVMPLVDAPAARTGRGGGARA